MSVRDLCGLLADARVRVLALARGALGLVTISDAFLYLILQRHVQFTGVHLPLLFIATPAVYLLLAVPLGRLADAIGRAPVIVAGYGFLLGVYGVLVLGHGGMPTLVACVALLGAYYAATDGVMMALASAFLPADRRGTGLALVTTANNVGRMIASVAFGWLWSRVAAESAVAVFGIGLLVALVLVWIALVGVRREVARA